MNDDQIWKMMQAYNAIEYPKHECLECDGTGREHDDTPCSNPNEAADCKECSGKGYWRKEPSQFDRMKAAINAIGSPNG